MQRYDDHAELAALLSAWVDGSLDDAGQSRMEHLMRTDAGADFAVMWLDQHAVLSNAERGSRIAEVTVEPASPLPRSAFRIPTWVPGVAAAILTATAAVTIYLYVSSLPTSELRDPTSQPPIATLIESTGSPVFVNDDFAHEGGEYSAGSYANESGSAQFVLRSNVTVDLRGKTRLVLYDPMSASLEFGSARFTCPPGAYGFQVVLPDRSQIVDLGTEFTIDVAPDQTAEVAVERGRVRWIRGEESHVIEAGVTARVRDGRMVRTAELGPEMRRVTIGPLRDGGFDIGFEWPPKNPHQFIGVTEASDAWVETATNPRMRLFSDDRLIKPHSPPSYAEFMGNDAGGAGLMQPVETEPGVEYELIAFLARSGDANTPTLRIDIADGPFDKPSPGNLHHEQVTIDWPARIWREHRVRFVARSHVTTIRFVEPLESPTQSTGPLIDSVQLNAVDTYPDGSSGRHDPRPTTSLNEGVDE